MTYQNLLQKSKNYYLLDDQTINYMVKYYLKLEENDIYNNVQINRRVTKNYFKKLDELKKGLPIQYVVGNVDFYGYNFIVKLGVLIPRFETEELVYYTKKYIDRYFGRNSSLIDIGTGSGVIGLSLKIENPSLKVTLTDISPKALKVASLNAKKVGQEVSIYKSNMLDKVIKRGEKYDILISNPPYVMANEKIMDIVKDNEPAIALFGGDNGLKYYEILLSEAKEVLNEKALIAFEIGASQASAIIELAKIYFEGCRYEIKKDLEGRDRMFFLFCNLYD